MQSGNDVCLTFSCNFQKGIDIVSLVHRPFSPLGLRNGYLIHVGPYGTDCKATRQKFFSSISEIGKILTTILFYKITVSYRF